ncbi:MAG: glycoside hydrolase family 25 protein [Flammeovirgaceae bacterium]
MRDFKQSEKPLLIALASVYDIPEGLSFHELLKKLFFTEKNGEALVIQCVDQYAIYYLSPEQYDDETVRLREIQRFLNFLDIVKELIDGRFLSFVSPSTPEISPVQAVQDYFDPSPQLEADRMIFNEEGDYSIHPEAILSGLDDTVIYKGLFLGKSTYDFLITHLFQQIVVAKKFKDFVEYEDSQEWTPNRSGEIEHRVIIKQNGVNKLLFAVGNSGNDGWLRTKHVWPVTLHKGNYEGKSISAKLNEIKASDANLEGEQHHIPTTQMKQYQEPLSVHEHTQLVEKPTKVVHTANHPVVWMVTGVLVLIGLGLIFTWYEVKSHHADWADYKEKSSNDIREIKAQLNNVVQNKTLDDDDQQTSRFAGKYDKKGTYHGIDISHYNGDIVEKLTFSDSISFIICKATEGLYYTDPYFHSNWKAIKKRGFIRGTYHFFVVGDDAERQAEHFWSIVQRMGSRDIPPIVDIERLSLPKDKTVTPEEVQQQVLLFLAKVEELSGRTPMVYTGESFANIYLLDEKFAHYPLWLAEYNGRSRPTLPKTWQKTGLRIWQKTSSYHVASEVSDFDVFRGKLSDLYE